MRSGNIPDGKDARPQRSRAAERGSESRSRVNKQIILSSASTATASTLVRTVGSYDVYCQEDTHVKIGRTEGDKKKTKFS